MKNHFSSLSLKLFKIITVIYCFLGDILIALYLWRKFSDFTTFLKIIQGILPLDLKVFDDQFIRQLFQLNLQNLKILIGVYLFLHVTIYVCHLLNRSFTVTYLKFFTWIAAPCCLAYGVVALFQQSGFLNGLFFVQGLFYSYVALGFYYKKHGAKN